MTATLPAESVERTGPTLPCRVVIAGQGYVGLPLAMRAVVAGHQVVGFDVSVDRVKRLAVGESFVEDVSSQTVLEALATGRYQVTDNPLDCEGFDIAVISVPTPLDEGRPDLSYVESAAAVIASHLRPGCLVVLESTSYPGTTESLLVPRLEAGSGLRAGVDFHVGYSPERIDPGNARWTLETTPKLVSGIDARSLERTESFYAGLVEHTVRVSSTGSAELAKLLENTFRHVNIALVNELAMVAADLDVDIWEVIDAASTKPFGFMRFTPGPGVGGHLRKAGATVTVVDPHVVEDVVDDLDVRRADLSPAELRGHDAVVLVTDHDAFDYEAVLRHASYVLDTRHRLEGPRVEHL